MKHGAEPAALEIATTPVPPARTIVALPVEDPAVREAREALIRRLAADRLRDLRDDGVTLAYVARMYGVESAALERLESDLAPSRLR